MLLRRIVKLFSAHLAVCSWTCVLLMPSNMLLTSKIGSLVFSVEAVLLYFH